MKNTPALTSQFCILVALTLATPLAAQETAAPVPAAAPAEASPLASIPGALFSFRAEGVPIKQALAIFARANNLNIVPDLDIEGDVTVEFKDLPLDLAMRALLEANGYYFVQDKGLLRVRNRETRIFQIDYIQVTRAGQGSNAVQISSGGSGGSSGGGSSGGSGGGSGSSGGASEGSTMTVTNTSTANFWGDLSEQFKSLISSNGSFTVNSLSGTVLVRDNHRNIEMIAEYLSAVTASVVRQIDLEVEIYEVALNDSFQLGINWQQISSRLDSTVSSIPGTIGLPAGAGLIITNPVFGSAPPPPTTRIVHQRGDFSAVLDAMEEQGTISVVSKPRLRTLNNQPAVVRVGQDLPIFTTTKTTNYTNGAAETDITETITTVTVGTVLSITPQVSQDGLVTLDITPAVSRLVRMASSATKNTEAPVIDVRQASSIVRVRDGATIVMGGLVQDTATTTRRKIPLLGDIPLLGKAFTGKYEQKDRTELVFFLTPRIIKDAATEISVKTVSK
ncbi:MAG: secretin N-terminal domain-containing protein [Nibricoccus sp.]